MTTDISLFSCLDLPVPVSSSSWDELAVHVFNNNMNVSYM